MSNATSDLLYEPIGTGGRNFDVPVDGGSTIYKGTMVAQLTATGMAVAASTASSGAVIGVATHGISNASGADGAVRVMVHADRTFTFANGTGGNACSEATIVGAPVYAYDDHTVYDNSAGGTLALAGYFQGMEPDGRVRVFISNWIQEELAGFTSLETRVSTAEVATTSLETRVSTAEVATTSLETRVSTAESAETAHMTSSDTRVSTAESQESTDVASLDTRVSTAESQESTDVASLDTRVSTAESQESTDVASLDTRVSTAESQESTDVASIDTRVSTAESLAAFGYICIPLSSHREIDASGDVGNLAAHGTILASDSTPILLADGAGEAERIRWATGVVDAIEFSIALPADFDDTADAYVQLVLLSGATDAATFSVKTSWNGGAQVSDTADDAGTKSATIHRIAATIANADIPAGALSLSCQLIPDAHAVDAIDLFGVVLKYARV